jgi:hypothetical protein
MSRADALTAIVFIFGFIGVSFALYFIPAIVAGIRHHRNEMAIFMLNLFLGWTLVGWVAALVWACTADTLQPPPSSSSSGPTNRSFAGRS